MQGGSEERSHGLASPDLRAQHGKGRANATALSSKALSHHSATPLPMNLFLLFLQATWDGTREGRPTSLAASC